MPSECKSIIQCSLYILKSQQTLNEFNHFALSPLAHSFRQNTSNELCLITKTGAVSRWKQVLLNEYPVSGLTKILSLRRFETDFKEEEARKSLVDLFDLFIVHPAIRYKVTPKLVALVRDQNKFSSHSLSFCDF